MNQINEKGIKNLKTKYDNSCVEVKKPIVRR